MTTIAFKDGVLAADTLLTADGIVAGHAAKIWRHGMLLLGGAGSTIWTEKFRTWVDGGLQGDQPMTKDEGNWFVIEPTGRTVVWCDDGPFIERCPYWALGSGMNIALGAMAAGASAERAVEIACEWDTSSGPPLTVLRLGD